MSHRVSVNWPHPRWFVRPLGLLSMSANYGILWFVIAALPWLAGESRGFARFAWVAGSVLGTEILTFGLKLAVDRRRPPERDEEPVAGHIPLPRSRSFPSSHASMGMAGLLTFSAMYPASAAPLAVLVAVLAFSRVYLRVHYVADVLAGAALGAVLGSLIVTLFPVPA